MHASASRRRIDHLVMPAHDLEAQAVFYRRLGFTVGPRNRHPWGTENRIVQFDGTFLELIGLGAGAVIPPHGTRVFSFGRHVADTLAAGREGLSMLVLDSRDAAGDARWFATGGIGEFEPFFFERKGLRPDGTPTHVAFTLAFARCEWLPEPAFFVCQQHFPEAFWNREAQRHGNGVTGVSAVTMASREPASVAAFLARFAGGSPSPVDGGMALPTAGGRIDILSEQAASGRFGADPVFSRTSAGHLVAVTFEAPDIAALAAHLTREGVPHRREPGLVVVPSGAAFGTLLAFAGESG